MRPDRCPYAHLQPAIDVSQRTTRKFPVQFPRWEIEFPGRELDYPRGFRPRPFWVGNNLRGTGGHSFWLRYFSKSRSWPKPGFSAANAAAAASAFRVDPLFNAPRSAVVAFSSRNGPLCWSAAASSTSQLAICSSARDRMMDTRCRAGAGGYDGFTPERNAPDRSPRKFCWNLATPSLVACFAISPSSSVARTIQAFDLPFRRNCSTNNATSGGRPVRKSRQPASSKIRTSRAVFDSVPGRGRRLRPVTGPPPSRPP
jgi:hypothetical protein